MQTSHRWRTGLILLAMAVDPASAQSSLGLEPLPDLGPDLYQGHPGGLYPGGRNERPAFHEAAGVALGRSIVPLDANGRPDPGGKIGLMSIGMSNARLEWLAFMQLAAQEPGLHPALAIVDGAQGSRDAVDIARPTSTYWTQTIPGRLHVAGISPLQVQVIWLKEAQIRPSAGFPAHAQGLRQLLEDIVVILHATFPELKLCYLSSRSFAGYATVPLNPEPWSYEQGFAVKWLIQDQIQGKPRLNYLAGAGPVNAPWLSWGTYIWADGTRPRADGVRWLAADFQSDGTHPSGSGESKVARGLLAHFKSDVTSTPWFLASGGGMCGRPAIAYQYGHGLGSTRGVPHLTASELPRLPSEDRYAVQVDGAVPSSAGLFLLGWSPLPDGALYFRGGSLLQIPRFSFPVRADAQGRAMLRGNPLPADPAFCGGLMLWQYVGVDSAAPQGASLSRGLWLQLGD